MRQVRDTLVWLAMLTVVAGVIYVMPQVSDFVDAATQSEHGASCETCRQGEIAQHQANIGHHHDR